MVTRPQRCWALPLPHFHRELLLKQFDLVEDNASDGLVIQRAGVERRGDRPLWKWRRPARTSTVSTNTREAAGVCLLGCSKTTWTLKRTLAPRPGENLRMW